MIERPARTGPGRRAGHPHPRRPVHNLQTSISTSPAIGSSWSPGRAARARVRWPSTRSMPRGSGSTSRASRSTPGSSSHQLERPDVDLIEGLQPTISIDQRAGSHNPRSTVATVTEIYDYLRLLDGAAGRADLLPVRRADPPADRPSRSSTTCWPCADGTRTMILAPMVRGRKGAAQGRVRGDPQGRLRPRAGRRRGGRRRRAARAGPPAAAPHRGGGRPRRHSRGRARPAGRVDQAGRPARRRAGAGQRTRTKPRRRPDGKPARWHDGCSARCTPARTARSATRSSSRGRSASTAPTARARRARAWASRVAVRSGAGRARPRACRWPAGRSRRGKAPRPAAERKHKAALDEFLAAAGVALEHAAREAHARGASSSCSHGDGKKFPGVLALLEKEYATTTSEANRQRLEAFRGEVACPDCGGARLRPEARSVRVGGKAIHEITAHDGRRGARRSSTGCDSTRTTPPIAEPILAEIAARLEFLDNVGAGLPHARPPGRHAQRRRIAAGAAGDRPRLRAGRRLLRARRAVDRPAPARQPAADRRPARPAAAGQHGAGRRARRDDHAPGRLAGRPGPRRRAARRADRRPGHARRGRPSPELAHRPLPRRARHDRSPASDAAASAKTRSITHRRRHDQQSQERHRPVPARRAGLRHRRERLGQELAGQRDARPGAGPAAGRHRPQAGSARQPARREPDRQGDPDRPVADRPHAAEQSGHLHRRVRRNPQGVRQHPRGAKQRGYKVGRFSFNVKGGRCEECQGQGQQQDRNELPARPVRHLPRVRGQAVQSPDARDPLPRQVDRRRARHAGRRGGRVLRELPASSPGCSTACTKSGWAT